MAHFARIQPTDKENIYTVVEVLGIEQDVLNTGLWGDPKEWVQTSYNTHGGIHYAPNSGCTVPDGGVALRANYASIGGVYDSANDVFYSARTYDSWTIGPETNWLWRPPVPIPSQQVGVTSGGHIINWKWDNSQQQWVEPNLPEIPPE
jgi:hypothetical protein